MNKAQGMTPDASDTQNLAIDAEINAAMTARKEAPKTGAYAPPKGRFARLMSRIRAFGAKIAGQPQRGDDGRTTQQIEEARLAIVRKAIENMDPIRVPVKKHHIYNTRPAGIRSGAQNSSGGRDELP